MDRTEAWILLNLIPGIGPRSVFRLLEIFHTPEAIIQAPPARIRELNILKPSQLREMGKGPDKAGLERVKATLKGCRARALAWDDPAYPEALRRIDDPPPVLYIRGSLEGFEPAVAVVGTRAPSHYGALVAESLSCDLAAQGMTVVSGLARGIDTRAHAGTLKGGGKTVAVLGTGIDVIYPPENAALAEKIAMNGAVVSELPPGTRPDPGNFPRRNRIISGLSSGVIVVEAAPRSGALITARLAGEQGRTVMAVPGPVTNLRSKGPHRLIREGAALVRDADDVMMEIAPEVKQIIEASETGAQARDEILDLMGGEALSIDDIAHELGLDVAEVARRMSVMELAGEVVRTEGNRFMVRSIHG